MGANKSRMSQYFKEETVNERLKDSKFLIETFRQYQVNNGIIGLRSFSHLIRKPSDPEFCLALFNLFKSKKDGLTFNDYKIFYLAFTSNLSKDKIHFISELIFDDNAFLSRKVYLEKVAYYFKQTNFEILFKEEAFITGLIVESEKEKEIFYSKDIFVGSCFTLYISLFKSFTFINPVHSATDVQKPSDNKKISMHHNYACNCLIANRAERENKEAEDNLLSEYDKMKSLFEHIADRNDGTFPIQKLKEYFDNVNVKEELQVIILSYLRNITLRPFIDFTTFKTFMIQCTKGTDKLCELLFNMILYPAKEGSKGLIEKALNLKLVSKEKRENDMMVIADALSYKEELGEFLLSIDSINMIPFSFFKIKPLTVIQLNKVIEFIMLKLPWEDYLVEQIDKENNFYVIHSSFWIEIEPSMSQDSIPKTIDNKSLTPNGLFLIESSAKYKDDFIILPESIYAYMKKWFEIETEIVLSKKIRRKEIHQKGEKETEEEKSSDLEITSTEHNKDIKIELGKVINRGDYLLISKGQWDYEIDLYFIQFDVYSFKIIYAIIEGKKSLKDKCKECLNEIYQQQLQLQQEKKKKDGKLYSTRSLFSEIKQYYKSFSSAPIRLFCYYNSQLLQLSDESTFKKENIKGYCILILDSKVNDTYYYDMIHPLNISAKDSALKDSQKKEKTIEEKALGKEASSPSSITSNSPSVSSPNNENALPLGLGNMGNTCYFNSVLQIFLNLPILNELFDSPKLDYFINKNNKFGQQGQFIKQYFSILAKRKIPDIPFKKYMNSVATFKKIIGKINEQFNNFEQQDANEFFIFLLETFHEELNIKNKREYLENPPQLDNTDEELSNLNFANTIRRGASFIDALFLFQLKSYLTCSKCEKPKIVYETNYILDIPVMVDTMIEVEVVLNRLPFELKIYYEKVKEEFKEYNNKHSGKNIIENLRAYADELVEGNLPPEKYYLSSRNTNVPLSFRLKCDRTASAESLLKRIRLIKTLELEPPVENKVVNENEENKLIKTTCNELTTLLIYRVNGTKVSMETQIDDCFPSEQKRCIVYEHLNTNGLNMIMQIQEKTTLVRHKAQGTKIQTFDENRKKQATKEDCLCVSDYLSYYSKQGVTNEIGFKNNLRIEYVVDIEHYHVSSNQMSPFGLFYLNQMRIKKEWLIINNSGKIKATALYDIIWENNKRILKSLRKEDKDLWWKFDKEDLKLDNFVIKKMCYPFILRYCIIESQITKCGKCPWYSFCPGCLINPYHETYLIIPPNITIVVDWCDELIQTEFVQSYSNICYTFKEENVKIEGEISKRDHTLDDCFALFCEKEKLEDQIYCDKCASHQYFIKNYDLCKPPPILIISLKRFKFNQHSRYKIRTFINFPINNMVIKGEQYNLFGIINHYGSISGGHYTSMIKVNDNWLSFDDSRVSPVTEKQIMTENAYLLIYCSEKSPLDKSYYHRLYSILSNIEDTDIPNVIMDNCYFFGEPILTPYGRGYCLETIENDNRLIIPIKYIFGQGFIHRKNATKETVIEIKPKEKDENNKEEEGEEEENQKGEGLKKKRREKNSVRVDCILI